MRYNDRPMARIALTRIISIGLLLLVTAFSWGQALEVVHPLEEMCETAHHQHQNSDAPLLQCDDSNHGSHGCVHLQKLVPTVSSRRGYSIVAVRSETVPPAAHRVHRAATLPCLRAPPRV